MPKSVDPASFLEYFSKKIIKIAVPVIVTLVIDAALTRFLERTHGSANLDRSFSMAMTYSSSGFSTLNALYIALILIGCIILITALLLLLYYFGCTKVIFGWLGFSVSMLMSYFVYMCFNTVPSLLNIPVDYITGVLLLLNLVVVADMSVFWRAPKVFTHIVMVFISVLISLVFLNLPDFTIWILLGILVIYDICVVLCPHGLLKVIIEKSEERGDAIPALLYASAAWFSHVHHDDEAEEEEEEEEGSGDGTRRRRKKKRSEDEVHEDDDSEAEGPHEEQDIPGPPHEEDAVVDTALVPPEDPVIVQSPILDQNEGEALKNEDVEPLPMIRISDLPSDNDENDEPKKQSTRRSSRTETSTARKKKKKEEKYREGDDEEGIKLGLGDFVFYGILVTRAARLGWDVTILVIFAVVLGLSVTLICLAKFQRALPALPFSLILGTIFFMTGSMTFRPFANNVQSLLLVL